MTNTPVKPTILYVCFTQSDAVKEFDKEKKKERALAKLPPCNACSVLVKSFEKGLERTSRGRIATDKAYALFDLKK